MPKTSLRGGVSSSCFKRRPSAHVVSLLPPQAVPARAPHRSRAGLRSRTLTGPQGICPGLERAGNSTKISAPAAGCLLLMLLLILGLPHAPRRAATAGGLVLPCCNSGWSPPASAYLPRQMAISLPHLWQGHWGAESRQRGGRTGLIWSVVPLETAIFSTAAAAQTPIFPAARGCRCTGDRCAGL